MENKKSKNILVVSGVLHGHFTGSVEIVRELSSLGHNVTVYVLDDFKDRMKDVGAKVVAYKADGSDYKKFFPPQAPPAPASNVILFGRSFEAVITLLSKDETKYDYYVFDSFFDIKEMNKIFKFPLDKYVLIYTSHIFTDEDQLDVTRMRKIGFKSLNEKYNLNFHEFVEVHYIPNKFKKLILTSKLFHYKSENCDETCYFMGPNIEKRKFDENFKFKKDKNKKLIYVSCGTIFNNADNYYKTCIEAFKDSDEYQLIMSVGKPTDISQFKDIPKNISIYNYVPQTQLLPEVDIFITHGGLNSTQESLLCGIPLIVIPQKYDQFDNARKIEQLKAGIFIDKNKTKITVDVLRDAVKNIIENREKYKKGVDLINKSFIEARDNRKNIYEQIFV